MLGHFQVLVFLLNRKMAAPGKKRDAAVDMVELEKEENEDEDNSDLYDELVESDGSDTDESIYGVYIYILLNFVGFGTTAVHLLSRHFDHLLLRMGSCYLRPKMQ